MNKKRLLKAALSTLLGGAIAMGMQACGQPPSNATAEGDGHSASQENHDGHDHEATDVKQDASATGGPPSSQLHGVMMRPMENMNVSGDVDQDFASLMIPHHQGAVDMAKIELEHGKNEELKKLAQAILDSQAKEIEALKRHAHGGGSGGHAGHSEASAGESPSTRLHKVMMRPMKDMTTTGDVDRDFAALMIPHHQGAIDMAKIELQHGKNDDLKALARSIADSQAKEIEILEKHAKG